MANVRNRHELLLASIGVFEEESNAYDLVTTLSWALPLTVILSSGVDGVLAYLYMRYYHPWKEILFYEDENKKFLKRNSKWSIRRIFFPFMPDDTV